MIKASTSSAPNPVQRLGIGWQRGTLQHAQDEWAGKEAPYKMPRVLLEDLSRNPKYISDLAIPMAHHSQKQAWLSSSVMGLTGERRGAMDYIQSSIEKGRKKVEGGRRHAPLRDQSYPGHLLSQTGIRNIIRPRSAREFPRWWKQIWKIKATSKTIILHG